MPRTIQPSFARGEVGPDLYGRVDIAAYDVALRTAYNAIIHSYGGASNRGGFMFIGPVKTHTGTPPRLIEFKYNTQDTYILEFGDQYMRPIRNDAHILETAVNISGATAADPVVVTANAHGYSNGDQVYITGVVGMTELNGRWFTVANVATNTFELTSQIDGTDIDGSAYTAYSSGGTVSKMYEITTPYAVGDLLELKFVQSANVMTLTHPDYEPRELTRTDHDAWTLSVIEFHPIQDHPTNVAGTSGGSGTEHDYKVTAINAETQEESLSGLDSNTISASSATAANPVVVTATAHGLSDGDEIEINDFSEMTEVNGRRFKIDNVTTNTFELVNEDGSGYAAETTGGNVNLTFVKVDGGTTPDGTVTWDDIEGVDTYSVYRKNTNGVYGWIGDAETSSFTDNNIDPDTTITPPRARNPFFGADNYPGSVSYFEQRRVFGQSNNDPDTTWYSVTGAASNMSQSSPRQADDAITATLNAREVNEVRHFVPGNDLLIFTSGSEWRVNSGGEAAFSAETLRQKPQTSWGSSHLRPLVFGDKTLFVTENDSYVRSIGYQLEIDGYTGNDMTVFAPHLFDRYTAVDWAQSRSPDPVATVVRSDGFICNLTFNPEQQVVGWSRWETDGKFKRIASTRPSTSEKDATPYCVVERTVGGNTVWYIEKLVPRRFYDVRDAFFVDSGLSLDSPVDITNITAADPIVVTAASHGFSDGDEVDIHDVVWEPDVDAVFNKTQPQQLNGDRFFVAEADTNTFKLVKNRNRVDISGVTQADPAVVTTTTDHGLSDGDIIGIFNVVGMTSLNGNIYKVANSTADTFELNTVADATVDSTGFTAYSSGGNIYHTEDGSSFNAYKESGQVRKAVSTITGMWHLEGRSIIALADGDVVSGITVTNGQFTLSRKYSRVHAGLRFICDLETLDPEPPRGTIQGRSMRTPFATFRVKDTRGLYVGPNENELTEVKQREFERMGEPTRLKTGDIETELLSDWDSGGRVFIRQIYPLPLTLLAVVPFLDVGDDEE